jgi:DNA transformation protein
MPVSPSYRTYILDQLEMTGHVAARAMFGGVGLYFDQVFFGLIADDTLYFKVDDSNRAEYQSAGSRPFQPYGDDSYSMQYFEVPADVQENRMLLREWADRAVAVARRSATAKGKRPRKPD